MITNCCSVVLLYIHHKHVREDLHSIYGSTSNRRSGGGEQERIVEGKKELKLTRRNLTTTKEEGNAESMI